MSVRAPVFDADYVERREACHDPERPPTATTEFIVACPACMIALRAATTIPTPPGEFTGWYDQRDHIRADLLERRGIVL